MGEYDAITAMAQRLIAKKGTTVGLTRPTIDGHNIVAGTVSTDPMLTNILAVISQPSRAAYFQAETLNRVAAREFTFALKGATMIPQAGDVVTVPGGAEYRLFYVSVTAPDEVSQIIAVGYAEAAAS